MNKYTLIGSVTSPYVRRLRILMKDLELEFKAMMIFDPTQRVELKKVTPILKIPVLQIHSGDKTQNIYESRVIFNYLNKQHFKEELSLEEENLISIIDGINDSFVTLYMMKLADMPIDEDKRFIKAQRERIAEGFSHLNSLWAQDRRWNYTAISLYCLIDWALFRDLYDFRDTPVLLRFHQAHNNDEIVKATDPRS